MGKAASRDKGNNKIMSKNLDKDLQEEAFSQLAVAVFIRAAADLRGRIDRSEGNLPEIQKEAELFLTSSIPEWRESRKFWSRIGNIDQFYLEDIIVPALMDERVSFEELESVLRARKNS